MRKFEQLVKDGKMKQEMFDQFKTETNFDNLPERIHPPKKKKK